MKVLLRTQFGDPILRKKTKEVQSQFLKTQGFKNMVLQMFYTMEQTDGVGLAAPQIGKSLRLAVIQVNPTKFRKNLERLPKTVIINPRILWHSKEEAEDWEGCLSFPDARGKVFRYKEIKVRYTNENGQEIVRDLIGFSARVFQHEIDHLNGILYIDRMRSMKSFMSLKEFKKRVLKSS